MATANLTAHRLREILHYNPETGAFHWISQDQRRDKPMRLAGTLGFLGYRVIRYKGRAYYEHSLAWLYMTGALPTMQIDHIDGVKSNNVWANLRHVAQGTNKQNIRTSRANNKTGFLGVHWCERRSVFVAQIHAGKQRRIGDYATAEEAHQAYLEAKRKLHEGCTI